MNSESPEDRSMKELWQSQKTEGVRMVADPVRMSASSFQRKIRLRNGREYGTAMAVSLFFGYQLWQNPDLMTRCSFGLLIAGMAYLMWQLHFRGSWTELPEDKGLSSCLEFQRGELERQRNLVSGVWRWYLSPLIPGLLMLFAAIARSNPGHLQHMLLILAVAAIPVAVVFLAIAKLNATAARALQRQIDELDELSRQPGD